MKDQLNITEWIEKYDLGHFDSPDRETQCDAGWHDWFCKDSSLAKRLKSMAPKVKKIAAILGEDFCKTHYVFFKNNCALYGGLYDDFRFCDMETGDVVYTITPKSGHKANFGISSVWCRENKSFVEGAWKDIIQFFEKKFQ